MLYAGFPGPSPAISAQFTLKMCVAAGNRKKIIKNRYFGKSRSFKIIDNCGKITTFRRVAVFKPVCAVLLEPKVSRLQLLKSTFSAKHFIRRLSWSNSSHFVAVQCWNVRCIQKLRKIH